MGQPSLVRSEPHRSNIPLIDPEDTVAAHLIETAFTISSFGAIDYARVLDLISVKAQRAAHLARGGTAATYPV